MSQTDAALTSAYSALSYVYHRERSRLTKDTQKQVYDAMCEVEQARKALVPLDDSELAEAQRLYEQTTQGEWSPSINRVDFIVPLEYRHNWENDAAWIAAAHNLWPALMQRLAKEKPDAD